MIPASSKRKSEVGRRLASRYSACTLNYGLRSSLSGYTVVQRPTHGTLGTAGRENGWILTAHLPNADYVGDDEFAVRVVFVPRGAQESFSTIVHKRLRVGPWESTKRAASPIAVSAPICLGWIRKI